MSRTWENSKWFLWPYFAMLVASVTAILFTEKTDLFLFFNKWHAAWADILMPKITLLAEWPVITPILILLLLFRPKSGIATGLSIAAAGLTTQVLKRLVFSEALRPSAVFSASTEVRWLQDVVLHSHFSFPSGHTTAVFALFFSLSVLHRAPVWKLICLMLAAAVGYSRIYLGQHFLEDVVAGSLVGVFWAFMLFAIRARLARTADVSLIQILKGHMRGHKPQSNT